jgi:hypothetical protein
VTGENAAAPFQLTVAFSDSDSPIRIEKFYGDVWMDDFRQLLHNIATNQRTDVKKLGTEMSIDCGIVGPFTALFAHARQAPTPAPVPAPKPTPAPAPAPVPVPVAAPKPVAPAKPVPPPAPVAVPPEPVEVPELPPDLGGPQELTVAQMEAFAEFEEAEKRKHVSAKAEALKIGGVQFTQAVEEAYLPREEPLTPEGQMRRLKISLGHLRGFAQTLATRKVARMVDMMLANQAIEQQIHALEKIAKGGPVFPPKTQIVMKLFDNDQNVARIIHISSSDGVAELTARAEAILKKNGIVLWVRLGKDQEEKLTDDRLRKAHILILTELSSALVLRARSPDKHK